MLAISHVVYIDCFQLMSRFDHYQLQLIYLIMEDRPARHLKHEILTTILICSVTAHYPCTAQIFFALHLHSVQFSSVTQSCPTLCDPINRSTPGLPVHHQLPEFTQTHVHPVSPAISSSVVPFSSCPQSLLASESFPVSQLFV